MPERFLLIAGVVQTCPRCRFNLSNTNWCDDCDKRITILESLRAERGNR
jgi:hypothetical protein